MVLSAGVVPCAFISGVIGQFFRQFAVTIAISTIISAFNSLTLSPALAVLLLKPRSSGHGEALPRIGLAAAGIWAGSQYLAPWLPQWIPVALDDLPLGLGSPWPWIAGAIGGVVVWFAAGLINAALLFVFRVFNAGFNLLTGGYVATVGLMLRTSVIVLILYAGLMVLTYKMFSDTPTGFIPSHDKGYLIVNVRLPDSASLARTEETMHAIERLAGNVSGVSHTVAIAGQSLLMSANAPNFGSMYVMLDEFHERAAEHRTADVIADELKLLFENEVRDGEVNILGAPPIDGLGTAGGFKIVIEDRADTGLPASRRSAPTSSSKGPTHTPCATCSPAFARIRPGCTWTSIAPRSRRWTSR